MNKQKKQNAGYGKILDAWSPSEDSGEPVGCVATSFTFSPVLFEEDCLGRFLQLETDATEDGPAYLVEREEKLSQLICAAALVDQHHARGLHNLRWDLLSARLSPGILHAKVSLLLWSRRARLIIASANLTEDGYRRNHEVFGALDYFEGCNTPLAVLDEIIAFLREAVRHVDPAASTISPTVSRWNGYLERVSAVTRNWGLKESPRSLAKLRVFAVLTGAERPSAFEMLRSQWLSNSPPNKAFIVSPFFDPPEATNAPARELWTLLKQRGEVSVNYEVVCEDVPGENAVMLRAPKSLLEAQPGNRSQITTTFARLKLEEGRTLHAKYLRLLNDDFILSMVGSSNFTSAGLGMGEKRNLEANLAFTAKLGGSETKRALLDACLPSEKIPDNLERRWIPRTDDGDNAATDGLPILPPAFGQVSFGCDERQSAFVEFTFSGTPPLG